MTVDETLDKLREALEFYANSDHYAYGPNGGIDERDTVMELDRGETARAALARCEGGGQ